MRAAGAEPKEGSGLSPVTPQALRSLPGQGSYSADNTKRHSLSHPETRPGHLRQRGIASVGTLEASLKTCRSHVERYRRRGGTERKHFVEILERRDRVPAGLHETKGANRVREARKLGAKRNGNSMFWIRMERQVKIFSSSVIFLAKGRCGCPLLYWDFTGLG